MDLFVISLHHFVGLDSVELVLTDSLSVMEDVVESFADYKTFGCGFDNYEDVDEALGLSTFVVEQLAPSPFQEAYEIETYYHVPGSPSCLSY